MKRFTIIFLIIAAAELMAIYNNFMYPWLEYISKPLIVLSLIILLLQQTKGMNHRFKRWILIALFFSWLGDILLMFTEGNENFFLLGLVSFLTSHIFYIVAFTVPVHKPFDVPLYKKHTWLMILPYAYAFYIFSELKGDLGDLALPVLIYVAVISTMLAVAMNRYGKVNTSSYNWILFGALAFVASDSILAIDKFQNDVDYGRYLIMLTYMFAQFSITRGAIQQLKEYSA